ncbi:bifunctional hydroxymethylpyrimidine kinase/phosphomethylpyrimidine kinase [Vibrio sp. WJH972]
MTFEHAIPIVLTIAGSDSGGGAGIQADIKAISATGGYACSAITALTAQNSLGVTGIYSVSASFVEQQLDALFLDFDIKAIKVGMLSDSVIIKSVASTLSRQSVQNLIIDPVMVATSGDLLLENSAVNTLISDLLPLADLLTPNLAEAAALVNLPVPNDKLELEQMIENLKTLPTKAVLLKGGHIKHETNDCIDYLIYENQVTTFTGPMIDTNNTHGTGCTLSSAIASYMAQGFSLASAIQKAKDYLTHALIHADKLDIGKGHGPVHHFHASHDLPY